MTEYTNQLNLGYKIMLAYNGLLSYIRIRRNFSLQ